MRKIKFTLVLVLFLFFAPAAIISVLAQTAPKKHFHLTIIEKTINGDGNFDFVLERQEFFFSKLKYLISALAIDFTNQPHNFSIATQNGFGRYDADYEYDYYDMGSIILSFSDNGNWETNDIVCESDNQGFSYFYSGDPEKFIALNQIPDGANIVCTFKNISTAALQKNPALFVPGLLGTEISDENNNLIWFRDEIINQINTDSFLDDLVFGMDLVSNKNLTLAGVIKKKTFVKLWNFDYTQGLIDEFAGQGYIEGEYFFTFPYDWRYGMSGIYPKPQETSRRDITNSDLLKDAIDAILAQTGAQKVDVIAHSMGGLIVKKYAMDNADPKIGKLVFLGVPNLGSIDAAKTLLMGNDFKITGLNDNEIYKISQNMPAAYDLLPSQNYFSVGDKYINDLDHFPFGKKLDYSQTNSLLRQVGLNADGLDNANSLHAAEFDAYDVRAKNIDAYNIVGCKSPTLAGINHKTTDTGLAGFSLRRDPVSGDDTVPLESAQSIPANDEKTFYAAVAEHGKMPSAAGIRQKIVNIITDAGLDEGARIYTKNQVGQNHYLCDLTRMIVFIVLSPVDIKITDLASGNILGTDEGGNIRYEIPGAGFEMVDGHKYVYLPIDNGQTYDIDLKGIADGTFTLIEKEINGAQETAMVFNDISVTKAFSAKMNISNGTAKIITAQGEEIFPTAEIDAESVNDIIPPRTTVLINNVAPADFYKTDISITLSAQDFAPEGITSAGVFSINYDLDGVLSGEYENQIPVSGEGEHILSFYATDKAGNKEEIQTIDFVIDKTVPEFGFSFDRNQKDLVFSAVDNLSVPENITISDQNGSVTATDQAGNSAKISFTEKNRRQSLRAQLSSLSYNGEEIDLSGARLAFAWFYGYTPKIPLIFTGLQSLPQIPKNNLQTNELTFLLQQGKSNDGSFVVALYAKNKTRIVEFKNKKFSFKTFSGLKTINFSVQSGGFKWSY